MSDLDRKELVLIIQCLEYRIASINLLPVYDAMLFAYKDECSSLHMKLLKANQIYHKEMSTLNFCGCGCIIGIDEYQCDDCKDALL